MDVAATGVFSPMERTYFDVLVTHPNAPSNRTVPPSKLRHEMEKKVKRIIQIEKGSFCPLIFSTSGGVCPLGDNLHKKLAGRIAIKRKENYGDVIRFIRTRLRFALLKCVLMGLRNVRGKDFGETDDELPDVSFGLIPQVSFCKVKLVYFFPSHVVSSTVSFFAEDTRVSKQIGGYEDCLLLQEDLYRILEWSRNNNMKLHEQKFELLNHLHSSKNSWSELPF